jgi:formylglycine-generating enzyme
MKIVRAQSLLLFSKKNANMRNAFIYIIAIVILSACGSSDQGQLVGVRDRPDWFHSEPYGMVYIPHGSFNMGPSDQDVPYSLVTQSKTVTVNAFYMDDTEITNNEYRQFVNWVRDSIAHRLIGGEHILEEGEYGERIDWSKKIDWDDENNVEVLEEMYIPENERYFKKKEFDTKKFVYEFYKIDLREAARKANRTQPRSQFVKKETVNIYPDTLAWIHDFSYTYNEPMTQSYFWHPSYDDYPVVGVTWKQARGFCSWRSRLYENYFASIGESALQEFRLPTEAEWEFAARGTLSLSPYPWGGPYIRNSAGCFLGNFKPMRGNYVDDGGVYTVEVHSYWPNDYGLYCMAGNVAEWTNDAFDESSYNFIHDLNPTYSYDAKDSDPPALKRKVIRGGSWKDVGYYLQTGTRSYEYQDTAKCYIGFRCVMGYNGRDRAD